MGLRTYQHVWLHDANPEAGDSTQHGFLRLPTKACTLKVLAFSKITHYIVISHKLTSITAVGNRNALRELMLVSKRSAGKRASPEELEHLRVVFGMGATPTHEDCICLRLERKALIYCLGLLSNVALCGAHTQVVRGIPNIVTAVLVSGVIFFGAQCLFAARNTQSPNSGSDSSACEIAQVGSEVDQETSISQQLLDGRIESEAFQYHVCLAQTHYVELRHKASMLQCRRVMRTDGLRL
jgi:hypothetical protein